MRMPEDDTTELPTQTPQEETVEGGASEQEVPTQDAEGEVEEAAPEGTPAESDQTEAQETEQDPEIAELAQAISKYGERQEIEQVLKVAAGRKLAKSLKEAQKLIGRKAELPPELQQELNILQQMKQVLEAFPEAAQVVRTAFQKFQQGQRGGEPTPDELEAQAQKLIDAGKTREGNRLLARAELMRTPEYQEIRETRAKLKAEEEARLKEAEHRASESVSKAMADLEKQYGRIDESLAAEMADTIKAMSPAERTRANLRSIRVIALEKLGRLDEVNRKAPAPPQRPVGRPMQKGQTRPAQRAPVKQEPGPVSQAELQSLARSLGGNRG